MTRRIYPARDAEGKEVTVTSGWDPGLKELFAQVVHKGDYVPTYATIHDNFSSDNVDDLQDWLKQYGIGLPQPVRDALDKDVLEDTGGYVVVEYDEQGNVLPADDTN